MFMASLTSEDPIYDEAGPSYDSNNPFEVQDHDAFVDHMDEYHDVHEMQNDVQHNYVVDSDADYTSDSNIIPYDQYVEDNEEHVVQCNASSVRNDALMSILDEMHEHLAEITRNRMLLKMQSPLCVENKVRIAPPDYSKENFLATFAPQRNLTPEQIFWSIDDNNRKKAETLALKPISALTVYPPNTPVKLVPRILPTKSQVKINLYVLTQLFTEFDKTCKTRITPSGLTEGERDKQCAKIEKEKNFHIENENLIVNCLSTQLLYDVAKSRCLDLEADVSKVHDESKLISKLEREYLNLQLKYQHLQESFDNKKSQASQEAPDFRSFFKIKNLEHQIQEKDNVIGHLKDLVANVNDRSREPYSAVDVTALIEQNNCDRLELEKVKQHYKELFDSIKILQLTQVKRHLPWSKRLHWKKAGQSLKANTKKNRILPAKKENKKEVEVRLRTNKSVWTKVNRVDSSISSKRVVINSNSESVNSASHEMCVVNILNSVNATPTVRIVLHKEKQIWKPKGKLSDNSLNKTKQIWKPKSKLSDNSLSKTQRVWKATGKLFADIGYQWRPTGKKLTLGKLDCGSQWRPTGKKFALGEMCHLTKLSVKCCSKHMTGNRSKLMNFVEKFIGSVRFGNDHLGAIMGYGDYVMGDSVISRVYYVMDSGTILFSVGQFLWILDLEVAFRKHTCFVHDLNGTDILKDLVRGLPRLKFEKDHLCSACQLGKSKKFSHRPKSENTNMEVLHTLHMDLCGSNGDETPEFVTNFLKQIQVGLNKTVRFIRTDNGMNSSTKLFDETSSFCTEVSAQIVHQVTSLSTTIAQDAPSTSSAQSHRGMLMQRNPKPSLTTSQIISERWTLDHPTGNIIGNPSRLYSTRKQLASMLCGDVSILKCPKSNPRLQNGRE
ncbi:hypothetical protein Tco_1359809 [Tanacetum coccineum]